jgi:hypothetical protein
MVGAKGALKCDSPVFPFVDSNQRRLQINTYSIFYNIIYCIFYMKVCLGVPVSTQKCSQSSSDVLLACLCRPAIHRLIIRGPTTERKIVKANRLRWGLVRLSEHKTNLIPGLCIHAILYSYTSIQFTCVFPSSALAKRPNISSEIHRL